MELWLQPVPTAEVLVTATRAAGPDTGDHGQPEASPKWDFLKGKCEHGLGGETAGVHYTG